MPDKRPEDQDNEPTRIVQRPGPKSIPGLAASAPSPSAGPGPALITPRPALEPRPSHDPRPSLEPPPRASEDPEATRVAAKPRLTPPGQPLSPRAVSPHPAAPPPVQQAAPVYQPLPEPPAYQPPPPPPVLRASPPPAAEYVPPPAPATMEPKPMPVMQDKPAPARRPAPAEPVVGWLVVIKGPGRGSSREVYSGRNSLGSDPDQIIPIDFGDAAVAKRGHAFIVYDNEGRDFLIEDGKQKELVRLNGQLLSETRSIQHGDEIRIGATTMKFVALCGREFDWADQHAPKSDAGMMAKDKPAMAPSMPAPPMTHQAAMAAEATMMHEPMKPKEAMMDHHMAGKTMVDDTPGDI